MSIPRITEIFEKIFNSSTDKIKVELGSDSDVIGKVGIDQTTDGTTNKVQAHVNVAGAAVTASNPLNTKDVSIPTTPTVYNVTMTTLNTEYSQILRSFL
jgi:hypothetical protein